MNRWQKQISSSLTVAATSDAKKNAKKK